MLYIDIVFLIGLFIYFVYYHDSFKQMIQIYLKYSIKQEYTDERVNEVSQHIIYIIVVIQILYFIYTVSFFFYYYYYFLFINR